MEHMLTYGSMRELTDEELARAVHLDPSQIAGLGPSLEALMELLRERKRKILETYETQAGEAEAAGRFHEIGPRRCSRPRSWQERFRQAVKEEQLYDIERLWYRVDDERSPFARQLRAVDRPAGRQVPGRRVGRQVRVHRPHADDRPQGHGDQGGTGRDRPPAQATGRSGQDGADRRDRHGGPGRVRRAGRHGEAQRAGPADRAVSRATWPSSRGWSKTAQGYRLTPKAYRLFQGRLLERIFSSLEASRTGRHQGPIVGEGAVEMQQTKPYEFGDSLANMDIPGSLINAMLRDGPGLPMRLRPDDIVDPSHPQHAQVRHRRALGHERLDALRRPVHQRQADGPGPGRPDPPRISRRLAAVHRGLHLRQAAAAGRDRHADAQAGDDLRPGGAAAGRHERRADERVADSRRTSPTSSTACNWPGRLLAAQDTPNRQIILITDGLPTAHFEGQDLYLLYPPDPRTEEATMREGQLCRREGITINIFLLQSWWQSSEDVQFAQRLAESTAGRVFFTAGKDLDRYVVWDYLKRRREILA